jgi:hypothetical protein
MISDENGPLHNIRLESGRQVSKDSVFHIAKNDIPVDTERIEQRVRQGQFQTAWGQSRIAHYLVPTNNGRYHFIISAGKASRHTLEPAAIPPKVYEYSEGFAGQLI